LLLGMIGPPGGGKTLSALAREGHSVRPRWRHVVIDTEGGRSRKYNDLIPFKIVEMPAATRSDDFLEAIRAQLPSNPARSSSTACRRTRILSRMARRNGAEDGQQRMGGMGEAEGRAQEADQRDPQDQDAADLHVPRSRKDKAGRGERQKREVVNIGWQPVAPLEIVHTLDLTCILPPRADGVPVWHSDKIGEDFIIKLPNYLASRTSRKASRCPRKWARRSRDGPRVTRAQLSPKSPHTSRRTCDPPSDQRPRPPLHRRADVQCRDLRHDLASRPGDHVRTGCTEAGHARTTREGAMSGYTPGAVALGVEFEIPPNTAFAAEIPRVDTANSTKP
jgi:hypothetical protein